MKLGRLAVETHCHTQRHAVRIQAHGDEPEYGRLLATRLLPRSLELLPGSFEVEEFRPGRNHLT